MEEAPLLLARWPFSPHKITHKAQADFLPEGLGHLQRVGKEPRALVYLDFFLKLTRKDFDLLKEGPWIPHLPWTSRHTVIFGLYKSLLLCSFPFSSMHTSHSPSLIGNHGFSLYLFVYFLCCVFILCKWCCVTCTFFFSLLPPALCF